MLTLIIINNKFIFFCIFNLSKKAKIFNFIFYSANKLYLLLIIKKKKNKGVANLVNINKVEIILWLFKFYLDKN